jgi:hypothetical protein
MTRRSLALLVGSLLTTAGGLAVLDAASATAPLVAGAIVAGAGLAGAARAAIGSAGEQRPPPPPRRRDGR